MRILLATYNYYPYNFGGSEVYVCALAGYLKQHGHEVIIAAAMPEDAFKEHPVVFHNEHFSVCQYYFNEVQIWGIRYHHLNLQHIYEKQSVLHQSGLQQFLREQPTFDLLHIHGFTATIGLDLLKVSRKLNPQLKVFTSYHTAISCSKGTLLYANKQQECYVKATTGQCTSCVISERTNLPVSLSRMLTHVLPTLLSDNTSAALQVKKLVNKAVQGFNELDALTDKWIVYSTGIQQVLINNDVPVEKIFLLRHGISENFFANRQTNKDSAHTHFLFNGRLNKIKGFHTLMKAWLQLPEINTRTLLITADPVSDDEISQQLIQEALKRKDVRFLGPHSQEAMIALYKETHCVIIPSECFEIGPLVYHESMVMGCNVISSDIGGCRELGEFYQNESRFFKTGNACSLKMQIENFKYQPAVPADTLTVDAHNKAIAAQYELLLQYEH